MQGTHYYSSSINGPAAAGMLYFELLLINASHTYSWSRQELLEGGRRNGLAVTTRVISGTYNTTRYYITYIWQSMTSHWMASSVTGPTMLHSGGAKGKSSNQVININQLLGSISHCISPKRHGQGK